ncbi:hypothetical protein G6011_03419 [Alternaria panax]|uniref:RING-type domain-containing protein n=1 Tax=Alternaria panax TaxID=48097 RepID=A0AAD4IF33_9PLEO|nr:hypothetical protein G6011_03419 [Alternaria panax]
MSSEADDWGPPISHEPASAEVYQHVCSRIRSLRDLRKFGQGHMNPRSALPHAQVELRKLEQQHFPSPLHTSRLTSMSDGETDQEAEAARLWLFSMLECQDRVMSRQHELGMFRRAVEKQMKGQQEEWTDLERLYMALTDHNLASPEERLREAFMVVFHFNYAGRRRDVSEAGAKLTERLQRSSGMDAELFEMREAIFERTQSSTVDHFACAIPLCLLTDAANNTSIVDDNAGCCLVCQNPYTSLTDRPIEELLADYPVRVKHCGHVVGKACLEQWMRTPKIEEAKYPYRTCPHCRTKIEGVKSPPVPKGLLDHLKINRRAMETVRELTYGYDLEREEHLSAIGACMSEEIACMQLLSKVKWTEGGAKDRRVLEDKLTGLRKEKWAWGFRGDGIWAKLREEWMNSGVVRRG